MVHLRFDERTVVVELEEARQRLMSIKSGASLNTILSVMGYPDEVRVPHLMYTDGEWRRWCYGVWEPGMLPLIGVVCVQSNLTAGVVRSPAIQPAASFEEPWNDVKCRIESVSQTSFAQPELRYIAMVSVANTSPDTPISMPTEQPALARLLYIDVFDENSTQVFSRRPWPMRLATSEERFFKIAGGQSVADEIHVFLSDVTLGVPPAGKYKIRAGLPFTEKEVSWSELFEFEITASSD
jgi:hypothetical protein